MGRFGVGLVLCGVVASTAGISMVSGEQEHTEQNSGLPHCPVMDEPVDFSVSTMTDDGPVYLCCPGCIKKVEKDPEKYAAKIAKQRAALAKLPRVQVSCPVSGEPVDKNVSIDHKGQQVYFCCPKCQAKFQQDPDAYNAKLAASYTYQTKCPVSGKPIDPESFMTLANGQHVYFCCGGCEKTLLAKPEKYAPNLAAQGYASIDAKLLKKHAGS